MKKELHIDIETYCDLDLKKVGVYRYVQHKSFEIILFSYWYGDDGDVTCVDLCCGEEIPDEVLEDMENPNVLKIAHNAPFEIICLCVWLGVTFDLKQWFCTLVAAAFLGLPLALGKVAEVLKLDKQKDKRGDALIRLFCNPYLVKRGEPRRRVYPYERPEEWDEFKEYNKQDVRTEHPIFKFCRRFPIPAYEWALWRLDFKINARGVLVDDEFARAAMRTSDEITKTSRGEIKKITGVDNPNSLPQLKAWLKDRLGYEVPALDKKYIADALDLPAGWLPKDVRRVLELRGASNKTSVKKYEAMINRQCADGRLRAFLQFNGANRTGRWAGRGVQPHNLPKNIARELSDKDPEKSHLKLTTARDAVLGGIADLIFDNTPTILSQLIRTAIVPPEGKLFAVSDFSAIEARVIAWLAGEEWRLDVFRTHGKIYEASASQMFGVPLEEITKDSPLRAKGKVSELALGYQGSKGALIQMGALKEGLDESELLPIVRLWRGRSPKIVKLWYDVEAAAKHVIKTRRKYTLKRPHTSITFSFEKGIFFIELPSGRRLAYYGAHLGEKKDPRGNMRETIFFWGINQTSNKWVKLDTYGGSLVENIVQAIARDLLADAMLRVDAAGIDLVLHVHDEMIAETDEDKADETLKIMNKIMSIPPQWAENLPLKGDGFITNFYKKD